MPPLHGRITTSTALTRPDTARAGSSRPRADIEVSRRYATVPTARSAAMRAAS